VKTFVKIGLPILLTLATIISQGTATAQAPQATPLIRPLQSGWPLSWCPDGNTLLIAQKGEVVPLNQGAQLLYELWAFDLSKGESKKLADNAFFPTCSPDSNQVAFIAFTGEGRGELRILDLQTREQRPVSEADWGTAPFWTERGLAFVKESQLWLNDNSLLKLKKGQRVSLAPDGAWAAISNGQSLWLLELSRGEEIPVLDGLAIGPLSWSPRGDQLAFVASPEPGLAQLWLVQASSPTPVLLAEGDMELFGAPSWSPDGRLIAFARYPLGAGTAEAADIWVVELSDAAYPMRPLIATPGEDGEPLWSPDGRYIAFRQGNETWLAELDRSSSEGLMLTSEELAPPPLPPAGEAQPLSLPKTIRVLHDARNYYRADVPPGQIDILDLESYVKRIVSYEVPSHWPQETLKALAVTARTYGCFFALQHASQAYDITDWVDYQLLGPNIRPSADVAARDTEGQYLAYNGEVILAEYSAENGDPTLPRYIPGTRKPDPEYPYLNSVGDPVGSGEKRKGHGRGLSLQGAKRWAEDHGWNYQQILAHYYPGALIQRPQIPGEDTTPPLVSIVSPQPGSYITSNYVLITANASDESSGISRVDFYARYGGAAAFLLGCDYDSSDGWAILWDLSDVPDTSPDEGVELQAVAYDGAGNVQFSESTIRLGLDRSDPTGMVYSEDETVTTPTVTLTLAATDEGSGPAEVAISNNWMWEGETFQPELVEGQPSGRPTYDPDASDSMALYARADVEPAGVWYGPRLSALEAGRSYRAIFRLKTDAVTTTREIALLYVVDTATAEPLGIRRIKGFDFREPLKYQEFWVDFHYWEGRTPPEIRLAFRGTADLYLDRVLITASPLLYKEVLQWRLQPGEGEKRLVVKFFDRAGNVSADVPITFHLSSANYPHWASYAKPIRSFSSEQTKPAADKTPRRVE